MKFHNKEWYIPGRKIKVNDKMYTYFLIARYGRDFHPDFKPYFTPKQMLQLGVFEGKYISDNDSKQEFPTDWYTNAKIVQQENLADPTLNYFGIKSRLSLQEWQNRKWVPIKLKDNSEYKDIDTRGWFQWYCRYYMGRRIEKEDLRQIKRWKAIKRHAGAIRKNCFKMDLNCRRKQRQALLHWAYDSRKI